MQQAMIATTNVLHQLPSFILASIAKMPTDSLRASSAAVAAGWLGGQLSLSTNKRLAEALRADLGQPDVSLKRLRATLLETLLAVAWQVWGDGETTDPLSDVVKRAARLMERSRYDHQRQRQHELERLRRRHAALGKGDEDALGATWAPVKPGQAPGNSVDVSLVAHDLDPLEHFVAREEAQRLLRDLTDRERQAFLLHMDHFSHAEIAQRLGIATATVGVLVHRARKKLRRAAG